MTTARSQWLEDDVGVGEDGVEELVVGFEAHDAAVVDEVWVELLKLRHGLVEDDAAVWVVDGSITADAELGHVRETLGLAHATEFGVGIDDGRYAL